MSHVEKKMSVRDEKNKHEKLSVYSNPICVGKDFKEKKKVNQVNEP